MPFPSWVEGEGKDRGQFILLSDSLSSSWVSSGRREDHFLEVSAEGVPCSLWCPKLSSVQCPRSLLSEQGCLFLCGSEEVSRAPSGRELLLHLTVAAVWPPEGRLVGRGSWFSPGRPPEAKHHAGNLDLHSEARVQSLCLTLTLALSSPLVIRL